MDSRQYPAPVLTSLPEFSLQSCILQQPKDLFKIVQRQTERQTEGIITLIGKLDFETQTMHTLAMYAKVRWTFVCRACIIDSALYQDPYTDLAYDTRNIVGFQLVVVVQDVQDVPPIFTVAPPLTKINNTIRPVNLERSEKLFRKG